MRLYTRAVYYECVPSVHELPPTCIACRLRCRSPPSQPLLRTAAYALAASASSIHPPLMHPTSPSSLTTGCKARTRCAGQLSPRQISYCSCTTGTAGSGDVLGRSGNRQRESRREVEAHSGGGWLLAERSAGAPSRHAARRVCERPLPSAPSDLLQERVDCVCGRQGLTCQVGCQHHSSALPCRPPHTQAHSSALPAGRHTPRHAAAGGAASRACPPVQPTPGQAAPAGATSHACAHPHPSSPDPLGRRCAPRARRQTQTAPAQGRFPCGAGCCLRARPSVPLARSMERHGR